MNPNHMKLLGLLIGAERESNGLSQKEAAHRCGIPLAKLIGMEEGKRLPNRQECTRLAKLFYMEPRIVLQAAGWEKVEEPPPDDLEEELVQLCREYGSICMDLDLFRIMSRDAKRQLIDTLKEQLQLREHRSTHQLGVIFF